MQAAQEIKHSGRVVSVEENHVTVAVTVDEACASCASRKACSLGTASDERRIVVTTPNAARYSVGERVEVATRKSVGMVAVALCYALPLVILVATLAACVALGAEQIVAAVASLAAVAVYYAGLWALRNRISGKISFTISKID